MTSQPDQPPLPGTVDDTGQATASRLPAPRPRPAERATEDRPAQADMRQAEPRSGDSIREQLAARLWRLPPGHPSSPYDSEGRLRPPVPDWRELGRALPDGEPREEAALAAADEPGDSGPLTEGAESQITANEQPGEADVADRAGDSRQEVSRSWLTAVPGLRDLWQTHEEKWPASERPSTDRSGDEPGSWRGDSGHYLNAEENLVSDHAKTRVEEVEEKSTPVLLDIKSEVPGAEMVGLRFRLKGDERFKEKVADELRAKPERSIGTISENMPDAMRYTYQFEDDRYTSGYWETHRRLVEQGYSLDFRRNSWESSQYKGLNTRWRTPDGQLFEIQFHTPESFAAKQLTHEAYERIRSPEASDRERDDLYAFQAEVSAHIPLPDGALTIPDYREERRELDG